MHAQNHSPKQAEGADRARGRRDSLRLPRLVGPLLAGLGLVDRRDPIPALSGWRSRKGR